LVAILNLSPREEGTRGGDERKGREEGTRGGDERRGREEGAREEGARMEAGGARGGI